MCALTSKIRPHSLDWLCYEHCFSACSYPFLTPAVHSMPSAYTVFNTNRQCKPTMQTHTPFYRSECHSAVFPSFRFSSSFTRSASCCRPFRLPTQLRVSKSAELPLVSARATLRSASALTPRSASWMLVWLVRFEQR